MCLDSAQDIMSLCIWSPFVHMSPFSMSGLVAGRGVVIVMGRLMFVHTHSGRQPSPVLQAPKFCCK